MKMVNWDGAAEFWAETAEDFVGFMRGVYGAKELVGKSSLFRFGEVLQPSQCRALRGRAIFTCWMVLYSCISRARFE
jgi:hypothetical protein